jgi:SAM-dependent methyltransferase
MINVPAQAVELIKLQRTGYGPLDDEGIAKAYAADVAAEVDMIEPYIPPSTGVMLDIGCGAGGIAAEILSRGLVKMAVLLDYTGRSTRRAGSGDTPVFQNDVEVTRALIEENGLEDRARIVDGTLIPFDVSYRFVLSTLSWGYHYPVDTYLDDVIGTVLKTSVVMLDVREETGGVTRLADRFGKVEIIDTANKRDRVVCRKPIM